VSKVVASFFYCDATGKPLARIDRIEPGWHGRSKEFLPYASDGNGGFVDRPGLNGLKLPLYHADEVRAAIDAGETVYLTEGEGKCDALRAMLRSAGSAAAVTTIQGGASAPMRPEHTSSFSGVTRAVLPADSDDAGRRAARSRAQRIADADPECDVRILDLYAERNDGSDIANWLAESHSLGELDNLVNEASRVSQSPLSGERNMPEASAPKTHIVTRSLSEIEPREVQWLWERRIIRGDFGIIAGLPGVGKSYLCAAIAAYLSRGLPLPGQAAREPCDVILLALEDEPESVLRPRFERLGADLSRVHVIDGVSAGDGIAPFSLKHVDLTAELLQRIPGTALIIIDPIASELGGVDTWRSTEVRAILDPFLGLTRSRRVGVLAVGHTTKRSDGHALLKVEGSLGGFVGRARYLLGVGEDENGQRGVGVLKSNYGATAGVPVVRYAIDETGTFSWGEETTAIEASDLFAAPASQQERSASEEARDAIIDALRGGELLAEGLAKQVRASGVHDATFNRERSNMRKQGKIERLGGGVAGPVRWRLLSIDSQEAPQIRTLSSAKECPAMRKSERGERASLFDVDGVDAIVW
jgi:hypothetical protein